LNLPTESERLASQLKHAFEGPAWHGPSVLEALDGVTPAMAAAHPIAGAHSIWELVLHLIGTYHLVLRRLDGDTRELSLDEDWPPIPEPTLANWHQTLEALRQVNGTLREAILHFDPAELDDPLIPDPPYTAHTQFIGMTQHDLYHAGQVILLKKALDAT
jgi:uncharacterized damage-inducible protein DinB